MDIRNFTEFYSEATKYMPKFEVSTSFDGNANALVLLVDGENYKNSLVEFDAKHGTKLVFAAENRPQFKGKQCETINVFPVNEKLKRVYIVSAGKVEACEHKTGDLSKENLYALGAKISNILNGFELDSATVMPAFIHNESDAILATIAMGIELRSYRFDKYFSKKKEGKGASLKNVNLVAKNANDLSARVEKHSAISGNIMLVRDLVNSPACCINPENYAALIDGAFKNTDVKVTILGESELEKLGAGALLAVGRASAKESKMVIMEYRGNPDKQEIDLAVVGKGVCFDSGGLSIKPAGSMEDMKIDMAGSAVSFATVKLAAERKLKVNLVGVVGLVENAISGNAYRPGDVLTSMSGQTIEVLNTDAEGRLVLADCLYYTQKNYKPKYMIDLATLTGAVTVALADLYAGMMVNDEEIANLLQVASDKCSDKLWRLPMSKDFDKMIDSTIADMKNVGSGRGAGTITAAAFLARFVNCEKEWSTKWAHLDIAGVAYDGKGGADPKVSKGATGWGVHLLYKFIRNAIEKKDA